MMAASQKGQTEHVLNHSVLIKTSDNFVIYPKSIMVDFVFIWFGLHRFQGLIKYTSQSSFARGKVKECVETLKQGHFE